MLSDVCRRITLFKLPHFISAHSTVLQYITNYHFQPPNSDLDIWFLFLANYKQPHVLSPPLQHFRILATTKLRTRQAFGISDASSYIKYLQSEPHRMIDIITLMYRRSRHIAPPYCQGTTQSTCVCLLPGLRPQFNLSLNIKKICLNPIKKLQNYKQEYYLADIIYRQSVNTQYDIHIGLHYIAWKITVRRTGDSHVLRTRFRLLPVGFLRVTIRRALSYI